MAKCPVCESLNIEKIINWIPPYEIWMCKKCDLVFSDKIPTQEELKDFYQGFLYREPREQEIENEIQVAKKEIKHLFNLKDDNSNKAYLDFGGGTGIKAKAAKELNLNVYFHEIDEEAIDYVKKQFEFDENHIIRNFANSSSLKFDYIFADNVIEHHVNPFAFIKELYALLKEGGTLIIKTPNGRNTEQYFYPANSFIYFLKCLKCRNSLIASFKAYLKRFWVCDPPRHLYAFSNKNIKEIVKKMGLKNTQISQYHIPFWSMTAIRGVVKRPDLLKNGKMIFAVIYIPFELLLKTIQFLLRPFLSPGGVILKVTKA